MGMLYESETTEDHYTIMEGAGVDREEAGRLALSFGRRMHVRELTRGLLGALVAAGLGLLGFGLRFWLGALVSPDAEIGLAFLGFTLFGLLWVYIHFAIVRPHRRLLRETLHKPACFECGYTLRGLPVMWDGRVARVVCPECRAASPVALPEGPVVWAEVDTEGAEGREGLSGTRPGARQDGGQGAAGAGGRGLASGES